MTHTAAALTIFILTYAVIAIGKFPWLRLDRAARTSVAPSLARRIFHMVGHGRRARGESAALSIWFRDSLTTRTSLAIGGTPDSQYAATLTSPRQALCFRILSSPEKIGVIVGQRAGGSISE